MAIRAVLPVCLACLGRPVGIAVQLACIMIQSNQRIGRCAYSVAWHHAPKIVVSRLLVEQVFTIIPLNRKRREGHGEFITEAYEYPYRARLCQQVITSACHRPYDAFHLQCEEDAGEP